MATSATESAAFYRMLVVALAVTTCPLTACTLNQAEATMDNNVATDEQSIIGGTLDDTSWCVAELFVHDPGVTTGTICTCSIIGFGDTCLTAAHCVDPRSVGAGKVFEIRTATNVSTPSTFTFGTSTTFDPRYDPNNLNGGHDFGIVHMANSWVGPGTPCFRGSVDLSRAVSLVGYGSNTHTNTGAGVRRAVSVPIVSSNSLLFQAGNSNAQACHGDSGGPAIQSNGWPTVVGVTSFGTDMNGQVCFNGSVSGRVDSSADWINQNVPCGNGICEPQLGESASSCPFDCHACGDGICAWGPENTSNCAVDCLVCGNGSCDFPEDSSSCPEDCGFQCLRDDPSILCLRDPAS